MNKLHYIVVGFLLLSFASLELKAQDVPESTKKVLTLEEAIHVAREQSLMGMMARHQFRSSYWEFRSYKAA